MRLRGKQLLVASLTTMASAAGYCATPPTPVMDNCAKLVGAEDIHWKTTDPKGQDVKLGDAPFLFCYNKAGKKNWILQRNQKGLVVRGEVYVRSSESSLTQIVWFISDSPDGRGHFTSYMQKPPLAPNQTNQETPWSPAVSVKPPIPLTPLPKAALGM